MSSKIYHIEFKKPTNGKKHFYFGSKKAIYDTFSPDDIGVSYNYLRSRIRLTNGPHETKRCTIRLGNIKKALKEI